MRRNPPFRRILPAVVLLVSLLPAPGCATPNGPHPAGAGTPAKGVRAAGYAIQFGAFGDVSNAARLARSLNERGIDAFYFRKDNGLYAVRFGDYPSRSAAERAAERLVKEKVIDSYFVDSPREVRGITPVVPQLKRTPPPEISPPRDEKSRPAENGMGEIAARTAERFVGIPYRWGGDTVVEGMDCSGFVRAVFSLCGVTIPRTSAEQFRTGKEIDRDSLKEGDLVFFGSSPQSVSHVGIYVGNNRFVHAPRRGEEIRVSSLDEEYYNKRFVGARRYF